MLLIIKFILFQLIIITGFLTGYCIKNKVAGNVKKIIRFNLIFMEPIVFLNATWGMEIGKELIVLPVTGFVIVFLGFILGSIFAKFHYKDKISRATFAISSSMSNHGFTMGAFVCYILIGFEGLSLSFIFILYFAFYTFGFIFNYAEMIRHHHTVSLKLVLKQIFNFQNAPLFATIAGLLLTVFNIPRPVPRLNLDIMILVMIFLYFLSLGTQFSFKSSLKYIKPSISLALIKFIIIPLIILGVFLAADFELSINIKLVIFIQSLMPTGVFSVVTSTLYDLDKNLSSGLFMLNTIFFMAIILPILILTFNYVSGLI